MEKWCPALKAGLFDLTTKTFLMDITLNLNSPNNGNAEAISKILEIRQKEFGECGKNACLAMALNILRSLRVQTKIANPSNMDISIQMVDGKYYVSWAGINGTPKRKRVIRRGINGPQISNEKVIWCLPKYYRGQIAHTYEVFDKIGEKNLRYLIVAEDEKTALARAKQIHKNRVNKHKGLAKLAISLCMKGLYNKSSVEFGNADTSRIAAENAVVNTNINDGFSKGDISIYVHDKLNYAQLALKNPNSVNLAIQNAVNKAIGNIKQRIKNNGGQISKSLEIQLNELLDGGI